MSFDWSIFSLFTFKVIIDCYLLITSVHMVERAPKSDCHQCLCPQGELQWPLPLPETLQDPQIGLTDPGFYQITASSLGLRVYEILCVPFKNKVFFFPPGVWDS